MTCARIQQWFGDYWDLPEQDSRRQAVDEHLSHCRTCAEEFEIWRESTTLIRQVAQTESSPPVRRSVTDDVMKRIYKEESWRIPVSERLYDFSYKLRRNITAAIAVCIMIFAVTFWISVNHEPQHETAVIQESNIFGRMNDPIVADGGQGESMNVHAMPTAVASLKGFNKPFMYQAGPIHTVKDYLLFLSLVGLTCTLLIMNWFSRTKQ